MLNEFQVRRLKEATDDIVRLLKNGEEQSVVSGLSLGHDHTWRITVGDVRLRISAEAHQLAMGGFVYAVSGVYPTAVQLCESRDEVFNRMAAAMHRAHRQLRDQRAAEHLALV